MHAWDKLLDLDAPQICLSTQTALLNVHIRYRCHIASSFNLNAISLKHIIICTDFNIFSTYDQSHIILYWLLLITLYLYCSFFFLHLIEMDGDYSSCGNLNDSSGIYLDCHELNINATRDYHPTLKLSIDMVTLYGVVYSCIFLSAVVGNTMVVAVVVRTPRMHTVTNFFIVNRAVLDILVAIFCIPVTFLDNIYSGKLQIN